VFHLSSLHKPAPKAPNSNHGSFPEQLNQSESVMSASGQSDYSVKQQTKCKTTTAPAKSSKRKPLMAKLVLLMNCSQIALHCLKVKHYNYTNKHPLQHAKHR
jgi:hypothetical protein